MASDPTGFNPADWQPLGYDVADVLYRYTHHVWAPKLNPHGLFTHATDADAYRAITDLRVPEHAPFPVFGLYSLKDAL